MPQHLALWTVVASWWRRVLARRRLHRACARREAMLDASGTPAIIFALHAQFVGAFADGDRGVEAARVDALLDRYAAALIARHQMVGVDPSVARRASREVARLSTEIRARSSPPPPRCRVVR